MASIWNPMADELELREVGTAQPAAAPRWSKHLANNPYGAYGETRKAWFDDEAADPNQRIQQELASYRTLWGSAAPEDDASMMALLASGKTPAPKNATPTQQWNAQPSAGAAGQTSTLLQELMRRAQQGLGVSARDPNIRAQVDPQVAQLARASRRYVDDMAERAGPNANLTGERRLAAERQGQAAAAIEGGAIGNEVAARRDEIAQALSLWGNQLSNQDRLALERELAQLNDRARTMDRGQNMEQFQRELALREWMAGNDDAYRWASMGG